MAELRKIEGWVLLSRDEDVYGNKTGPWYIAWYELFGRKKEALAFASARQWRQPYRAARAELAVTDQQPLPR